MTDAALDTWHEIAMSLRGAYWAMHRQAEGVFARYGLTADQFVVLTALLDGKVHAQSEVSRRTYSDPNTVGAILALMETRGLVRRMKHPKDRRRRTVALTPKGKRIFKKVLAVREATRARMEAVFTSSEVEALVGLLRRLREEISAR
jgi:DNA-binding MarR family transcriptional regulator